MKFGLDQFFQIACVRRFGPSMTFGRYICEILFWVENVFAFSQHFLVVFREFVCLTVLIEELFMTFLKGI